MTRLHPPCETRKPTRSWKPPTWLYAAMILAASVIVIVLLNGCKAASKVDGGKTELTHRTEARAPIHARETGIRTLPDGTTEQYERNEVGGEEHTEQFAGQSVGGSASAVGDKLDQDVKTTPSEIVLPNGGGVKGSGSDFSTSASITKNPLIWVGIILLLLGGAAFYFQLRRAAAILAIGGVGLIAASFLPAFAIWILGALGVVCGAVYLWAEYKGMTFKQALRAVTAGVEDLPDQARLAAKAAISSHADDKDVQTITQIKRADGLPAERAKIAPGGIS